MRFSVKKAGQQQGYTLIDVIISLFIIGVVLIIYAAASQTVVLNRFAKNRNLASRIGSSLIEDLRGTAFDSLPASGPAYHALLGELLSGEAELVISDIDADTKEARVVVRWRETAKPNQYTATFSTIIHRYGL